MLVSKPLADIFIRHLELKLLEHKEFNSSGLNTSECISWINNYIKTAFSISWSGGGTYGSCFDDNIHEIQGSEEPQNRAFMQFLDINFPSLTSKNIKSLNNLFQISEERESDYYGGSTIEYTKSINLHDLIERLERNYTNETMIDFKQALNERMEKISVLSLEQYDNFILYESLEERLTKHEHTQKKLKV